MRSLSVVVCTLAATVLFSTPLQADEFKREKVFDRPVREVFQAAQKVASQMNARIIREDSANGILVFSVSNTGRSENFSGYQAMFVAQPTNTKASRTTLKVEAIVWSPTPVSKPDALGKAVASGVCRDFFRRMNQELGFSNPSKASDIVNGGGLNRIPVPRSSPRLPTQ